MAQKQQEEKPLRPAQEQSHQPGIESEMEPLPKSDPRYGGGHLRLRNKVALVTGGDSGIGRAVALAFAAEGAEIAILYLNEEVDAKETVRLVESRGHHCLAIAGDVGSEEFCLHAVEQVVQRFGHLDILVSNAAEQHPQKSIADVTAGQLERTFRTNFFGCFFMAKAAVPHLKKGGSIINTTSVTAYRGSAGLLDYSASKGAIVSFTRSLAHSLVEQGIRVNAVAPGPIWTPLIPSTFPADHVATFGSDVPLGRAGEPNEVAPCYVFLASADASYMTGQVLHPNGGEIVNG